MIHSSISLALVAAFGYTLAALFLKSSLQRGANAAQVNFASNLAMGLVVQPLWFFQGPEAGPPLWQPVVCAITFFLGQVFTFAALSRGDVSVATPVMGTKIILVTAMNALVFGQAVSQRWWWAAIIGSLSIWLLAGVAPRGKHHDVLLTAVLALTSAFFFSLTDVLVQHWAAAADELEFLPTMFLATAVLSSLFYLAMDRSALSPPRAVMPSLATGVTLLGLQAGVMFLALAWSHDATGANVLYSSRSIWSVVIAWTAGHLLGLRDVEAGVPVMLSRLAGALLLFGAIILILF